jgi:hypothetical protein
MYVKEAEIVGRLQGDFFISFVHGNYSGPE